MTNALKRFFVYVGTTIVAGVAVFAAVFGISRDTLVDNGIGAGTPVRVVCPVRITQAGMAYLADAGTAPERPYQRKAVRGMLFGTAPDLELALPPPRAVPLPDGGVAPAWEWFQVERCVRETDAGVPEVDQDHTEPNECACRAESGLCRVQLADGGVGPAPFKETLGPGYRYERFQGAGCIPKSCGAVLQHDSLDDSWPTACPQ